MASVSEFEKLLDEKEGGYLSREMAKKEGDSGGRTYRGVSENNNPTWAGWKLIDEYEKANGIPKWNSILPIPQLNDLVHKIRKKKYWDVLRLDEVKNQSLANYIADFGYNSGPGTAAEIVTRILKLTPKTFFDIEAVRSINKSNPKALFDSIVKARVALIQKSSKIKSTLKPQLIERAQSFFFKEESELA